MRALPLYRGGFEEDVRGGGARTGVGVGQGPDLGRRSSYIFCPQAHGMMNGGMTEHATKAAYDNHNPGAARPCPRAAGNRRGRGGAGSGDREVNLDVVDLDPPQPKPHAQPQQKRLIFNHGDVDTPPHHHNDDHQDDQRQDSGGSLALVSIFPPLPIAFGSEGPAPFAPRRATALASATSRV